jgi:outer membrane protein OmpA-like peptidoglycan-associated protein
MIAGAALLSTVTTAFADGITNTNESGTHRSYEQARRFEVGPFVGYQYFEKKQNLKDGLVYGGRLGYNFNKRLGIEGSLGMVGTNVKNRTLVGAQKGQYRSPTDGVDLKSYQLGAIYQFEPDRRFSPFVTAGVGSLRYSPEVLGNNTSTIDFGIGAKYWMQRDVALRIDLKDQMDNSFHNYSGTIEVVFAFGGRGKRRAPAVAKSDPRPEPQEVIVVSEVSPKVEEKVRSLAAEPKNEDQIIVLAFEDVHFNFDKSTLTDAAKVILKRSIQILKDNPKVRVRIAGYTSASGTDEYNQALSVRRANAVEKYLVSEGVISPDRLVTIGFGKRHPAEFEVSPKQLYSRAARANMRVLFETIVK